MSLVSVVLPTYNRAYCLRRALDSIEKQTFQDWELTVVDDGSTDQTIQVWEQWLHERQGSQAVRLVQISNSGVAHARNVGVRWSKAPWLAFLDSDDEWLPKKLELQMPGTSVFRLIHGQEIWLRDGVRVNPKTKHKKFEGEIFEACVAMCFISPSTVLLERTLFEQVGGFDPSFPVCEDYDLWLKIASREPIGFVEDAVLHRYGGHADQLSRQFHSMDFFRVKALASRLDELKVQNLRETVAHAMLKRCEILLKGYRKHNNLINVAQVEDWALKARKHLTQFQSTHSVADRLPRAESSATL